MPNTREKLIELLRAVQYQGNAVHGYTDKYIQNSEIADHLIANGVTLDNQVSKWISVKDRLPMMAEVGEFVLAYTNENRHLIVTCWAVHKHKDQIIAWMPLPQPPKGE